MWYGMSIPTYDTAQPLILEYAIEFIKGYTEAVDSNYREVKSLIAKARLDHDYFPLYRRQLGIDLAIAAFYTQIDFYLFS